MRNCKNCGQTLRLENFGSTRTGQGFQKDCLVCARDKRNARDRVWKKANRERVTEINKVARVKSKELHRLAELEGKFVVANCKCKSCKILSSLDAERFDLSYKNYGQPTSPAEPTEPPKRRHVDDDRDKLMFNAGRFAGGARDKAAIDAYALLQIVFDAE